MEILEQNIQEQLKIKVIIVGDSGVGKTNIRTRFCQNKFDFYSCKTVGVQFSKRKFIAPFEDRMQHFQVHFWDVLGEVSDAELMASFFKNILGVIYVYDLTNQESLMNLRKWKDKVRENLNVLKVVEMLIANKKDLELLREVSRAQGEKLKNQLDFSLFFETSALEELGSGVEEAFYQFFSSISKDFVRGLKRPTKIRKVEGKHLSCI